MAVVAVNLQAIQELKQEQQDLGLREAPIGVGVDMAPEQECIELEAEE